MIAITMAMAMNRLLCAEGKNCRAFSPIYCVPNPSGYCCSHAAVDAKPKRAE